MPDPRPESDPEADGYAIEGPEPESASASAPIPPVERPRPRPASKSAPAPRRARRAPSSGVGQLWSRGAEWGANLAVLALGIVVVGFVLYATFSLDALGRWVMLLLGGLVGLAALAYPIFITLERPVRVTPEQALKDYFGALSHRVPHYRRMWLLLANDGRNSPAFRSFPEFKAHWKARLAGWKADARASGPLNPLVVEVAEFKAEKSAGQTEIEAEYTARVVLPGRANEPVATYRESLRLVRGSDKMWYMESGTLGG